jgi:acetyl esterase/lipase
MNLGRNTALLALLGFLAGCGGPKNDSNESRGAANAAGDATTLLEARKGFQTKLIKKPPEKEPVDKPPARIFSLVKYDSPVGKMDAYLSPDPKDGKKHPAIVWITGGDCNSIGDVWTPQPAKNDQTAAQYRQAGIVMMFPSLRGGNENPGRREGFLGEVDDVLAATDALAKQTYVDPNRIYLGGHSTGGTLVLLVSECSGRYRAVFSFGPAEDTAGYGIDNVWTPFDFKNPKELAVRAPGRWLADITSPTFVFEGVRQGNIASLNSMAKKSTNAQVKFFPVQGADHFSSLAPVNRLIAAKILKDDGPKCNLDFTAAEMNVAVKR